MSYNNKLIELEGKKRLLVLWICGFLGFQSWSESQLIWSVVLKCFNLLKIRRRRCPNTDLLTIESNTTNQLKRNIGQSSMSTLTVVLVQAQGLRVCGERLPSVIAQLRVLAKPTPRFAFFHVIRNVYYCIVYNRANNQGLICVHRLRLYVNVYAQLAFGYNNDRGVYSHLQPNLWRILYVAGDWCFKGSAGGDDLGCRWPNICQIHAQAKHSITIPKTDRILEAAQQNWVVSMQTHTHTYILTYTWIHHACTHTPTRGCSMLTRDSVGVCVCA